MAYGTYRGLFQPEWAGPLAKSLVLVLVGYGFYQNRHLKSLYLVMLGLGLNTLVIVANGGHMPVSLEALKRAGVEGWEEILKARADAVHSLLDENTRFPFLGDVIGLPPLRKAVSPGDLFILAGIAGVVVEGALRVGRTQLSRRQTALRVLAFLLLTLFILIVQR